MRFNFSRRLWLVIGVTVGFFILAAGIWAIAKGPFAADRANTSGSVSGTKTNSASTNTGSATGDQVNDFGACDEDIGSYCSGFVSGDWQAFAVANGYTTASWKLGLVDCLEQNREQTSQSCDDSLDRRGALNDALNSACQTDRGTYCRGVRPEPGSEPQVDCLKEHYDSLSTACAAAVDAHEAAKPTGE